MQTSSIQSMRIRSVRPVRIHGVKAKVKRVKTVATASETPPEPLDMGGYVPTRHKGVIVAWTMPEVVETVERIPAPIPAIVHGIYGRGNSVKNLVRAQELLRQYRIYIKPELEFARRFTSGELRNMLDRVSE